MPEKDITVNKLPESGGTDEFPAGMRVLAIDDDPVCLKLMETLLRQCRYTVTVTQCARTALKLLREKKGKFDIVITDVRMPDMDGFKLLEIVGLEMDLPVIMISENSDVRSVMEGIKHGAHDYLLKPIRMEELKNIWQHVIRKRLASSKKVNDSANKPQSETLKSTRRCRDQPKENAEESNAHSDEDSSALKRQRVIWTQELHSRFCDSVEMLGGVEKAVPKKILDIMGIPELSRENVASHLQKFRTALRKRTSMDQPCITSSTKNATDGYSNSIVACVDQGPYPAKPLNALRFVGCNNNQTGTIQFGSNHNSSSFDGSFANMPTLALPHNPQNYLFHQYQEPLQAQQFTPQMTMQHIHHLPEHNGLNYQSQSISSRPNQLVPIFGDSQIPSYVTGGEFGSSIHGVSRDLNEFGTVQNVLPAYYERPNILAPNENMSMGLAGNIGGVPYDMQHISGVELTRSGRINLVEGRPEHFELEPSCQPSCSSSTGDLNAVLKQIHCKRHNRLKQKRLNALVFVKYNLQLEQRQIARRDKDNLDPICLSDMDSDDEWITEHKDPALPLEDNQWMEVYECFATQDLEATVRHPTKKRHGPRNTQYDKGKGKAVLVDEEYGYSSDSPLADEEEGTEEGDVEGDNEGEDED